MRLFHLLPILALALATACQSPTSGTATPSGPNHFSDTTLIQIADYQNARDAASLLTYLSVTNPPKHRLAATRAFGSLQDTNSLNHIIPLLQDKDSSIALAAAYALGQTAHPAACPALLSTGLQRPFLHLTAWDAYGKCGTRTHLDSLLSRTRDWASADPRQAALMAALYRFGTRTIFDTTTAPLATQAIIQGDAPTRRWASAFLGRVRALGPEKDPQALLSALDHLTLPDDQQLLIRRLGRCPQPDCQSRLSQIISDPQANLWVRVNAIRALTESAPATIPQSIWTAAKEANPHLALEAATCIRALAKIADAEQCIELARRHPLPQIKAHLYGTALKHFATAPTTRQLAEEVKKALHKTTSPYDQGHFYIALATTPAFEGYLSENLLPLKPVLSTYIMDGLTLIYTQFPGDAPARVALLQRAVESGDVALIAQAATLIRDPQAALHTHIQDTTFLHQALDRLTMPRDVETWNEVRRTLNFLAGKPDAPLPQMPPSPTIDWALVKTIPAKQILVLETSKGTIRIQLHVEDAPATVGNIVRLTQQGYFDGKVFHRVVPSFVAQAGCPRGDGWGSVEPMIRSEWPGLPFTAGAVGMASAGKDTESCQFFITHCSTPHLDGRYTVFAYVVEGMSVVEALTIGDTIIKASLAK